MDGAVLVGLTRNRLFRDLYEQLKIPNHKERFALKILENVHFSA